MELEVRELTKEFGPVTAVRAVSFTAPAGQVTALLGPNGSGKTTTLRVALGLVRPSSGAALIGGVPYRSLARPRRAVGAMLEATGFHPGRRARDHLRVLAAGPLIVVAGVTGLVQSGGNVHDPGVQRQALAHAGLAALLTLIFGIIAVGGEYRYGSITDTYLSCPDRRRVITAKLTVYGLVGAAAGLVSSAVALAVTAAWWAAKGGSLQLSGADTWLTLGGGLAACLAFSIIGVGLGALIRNLVGAVAVALAWIALIDGIVGQLVGSGLARWLPFYASEALDRTNIGATTRLLPQWAGGLVLLGYAAVFAGAAVVTTLRRDVT